MTDLIIVLGISAIFLIGIVVLVITTDQKIKIEVEEIKKRKILKDPWRML